MILASFSFLLSALSSMVYPFAINYSLCSCQKDFKCDLRLGRVSERAFRIFANISGDNFLARCCMGLEKVSSFIRFGRYIITLPGMWWRLHGFRGTITFYQVWMVPYHSSGHMVEVDNYQHHQ